MGACRWTAVAGVVLATSGCLSDNPDWDDVPGGEDGPLVVYRFDEGGGEIARDRSGRDPALDLSVSTDFSWSADGLNTSGTSIAQSELPAGRVAAAVAISQEVTLELWVTPSMEDSGDPGPHRMVSNSVDAYERNFTLGTIAGSQTGWVARLRTSGTSLNGIPEMTVWTERIPEPTHVVLTHDATGRDAFYIQGQLMVSREVGVPFSPLQRADDPDWSAAPPDVDAMETTGGETGGEGSTSDSGGSEAVVFEDSRLDVWNAGYPLLVGNEITDPRGFIGQFHHFAIYDRALSSAEVADLHTRGVPE